MEAPEYFHLKGYCSAHSSDNDTPGAGDEHFLVEELLDFSNHDDAGLLFDNNNNNHDDHTNNSSCFLNNGNSAESSAALSVIKSCNPSSFSGCELNSFLDDFNGSNLGDAHFSAELCVPYDDLAELEWLSNFVEESFSGEYMQNLELISGVKVKSRQPTTTPARNAAAIFNPDIVSVPAKARSKRSRAIVSNWNNSSLLSLSPTTSSSEPDIDADAAPAAEPPQPVRKAPPKLALTAKKKDCTEAGVSAGEERRCMHCATDKTPQWRTGPMGPKTLCNACGVRYKSGRLVPEYRPASSPTFVLTKHSNSHRKVLELRRQKELLRGQQQQPQQLVLDHHQDMIFDASNCDNYLIHQHVGPDFRQLI